MVDTVTLFVRILAVPAAIWIWFRVSFGLLLPLAASWNLRGAQDIVKFALMGVSFVASAVLVDAAALFVLKTAFRLLGLLSRVEAKSFPLNAGKVGVAPWPDSWQEPCDQERSYFDFMKDDAQSS